MTVKRKEDTAPDGEGEVRTLAGNGGSEADRSDTISYGGHGGASRGKRTEVFTLAAEGGKWHYQQMRNHGRDSRVLLGINGGLADGDVKITDGSPESNSMLPERAGHDPGPLGP